MSTTERHVDEALRAAEAARPKSEAVRVWGFFGGALLLLQVYVWFQWITGPYFHTVPVGPSDPPMYMKIFLGLNAAVLLCGFPFAVWHFWIKPWRNERRITLDGMLMLSLNLMIFQDPMLNYFNTWCTYNTWLPNFGAWTSHIPGWFSPEKPGHQVTEPIINNFIGYGYGVLMIIIMGCAFMRKVRTRWPGLSDVQLVLVMYAAAIAFDFVMEALILLPFGLYSYPGAIRAVSFNAGTYYQWPIYEGFMWGGVQTAITCLRFFTDSRGRTIVERGLDDIRSGFAVQQLTRFLAIFAAVSASFFFCYMAPVHWFTLHADPWPEDVQKRSYFIGGICGEGTDRACPNPLIPIPSKWSGYVNTEGQLVLPEGAELPKVVPFERSGD